MIPPDYIENQHTYNKINVGEKSYYRTRTERCANDFLSYLTEINTSPKSILDIGCRVGYTIKQFISALPSDCRIAGIDIVPLFIQYAMEIGEAHPMDMHNMSFEDNEFEWLFCVETLEHAYDINKAIDELYRVASKGVYISIPQEEQFTFDLNLSHYFREETIEGWNKIVTRPGWKMIKRDVPEESEEAKHMCFVMRVEE